MNTKISSGERDELIATNKSKLETEKTRLEKLLFTIGSKDNTKSDVAFPNMGDSEDDNALEVTAYEASISEEKTLQERMRKVTLALEKIKLGTYGQCAVGGEKIDEARLRAMPEAETCVEHGA